jgi:ribonuclease BN (tRNA processing enzyme)
MQTVRVFFLGTGDAFFAGGRCQAAYLMQSPEGSLLLDCGSTALASLQRCRLPAEPIDTIFLSHLHGDHFAGLPFLFLHYTYIEPRSRPLRIIGPPEVESRVMMLYRDMYADAAAEPLSYSVEFIEAQAGKELCFDGIRIRPFLVPHETYPPSFGCEVEAGGRRIVYSGDAGWTEDLLARTQNADLFICECNYFETRLETHMDYMRISENLSRFGAKRIVLTHLGQEMLQHQQEIELELAHDGLVVTL